MIDLPNVASLIFKEHEGSFLVGMIAGRVTKTSRIGFVGGMDIPLIHKFETGYEEGARYANPNVQVFDNYVGVTDGAWNNPGKGKELAKAQIERGATLFFNRQETPPRRVRRAKRRQARPWSRSNHNWV